MEGWQNGFIYLVIKVALDFLCFMVVWFYIRGDDKVKVFAPKFLRYWFTDQKQYRELKAQYPEESEDELRMKAQVNIFYQVFFLLILTMSGILPLVLFFYAFKEFLLEFIFIGLFLIVIWFFPNGDEIIQLILSLIEITAIAIVSYYEIYLSLLPYLLNKIKNYFIEENKEE